MARIQHSIEIQVPAAILYQQLNRFEDYPHFLENVERVREVDDTRLLWTTKMANRPVEWEAEITLKEPHRRIAWRSLNGSTNHCLIEVRAAGPTSSTALFEVDAEPGQFPGLFTGDRPEQIEHHLSEALENLKQWVEARGAEDHGSQQSAMRSSAASFSGSPTEVLEDEPNEAGPGEYGKG